MFEPNGPYATLTEQAAGELVKHAEDCLAGTIQLAIAADQRAGTMAGIFGAVSVALFAAAATVIDNVDLSAPFIGTALVLFVATIMCAWSARPVDFYVGGYEPKYLLACANSTVWMKRYVTEDMQRRIDENRRSLAAAARTFGHGLLVASLSPLVGILIFAYRMTDAALSPS